MAETPEMSLAEAVNLCKKLEHEYRVFDNAAEAAKVVLSAYNEVHNFRKHSDDAKANLEALQAEISEATAKNQDLKRQAARSSDDLKAKAAELTKIQEELATFRPHYESEKDRLARDLAGLKTKLTRELEVARDKALQEITDERAVLEKQRDELRGEVEELTKNRDEMKRRVERAAENLG